MKKSIDVKDEKSEKLLIELKNLKQKLFVQEKIIIISEFISKRYLAALMDFRDYFNVMLFTVINVIGEKEIVVIDVKKELEFNGNL